MPFLIWRPNPLSLIALGILLADQVLDLLIELTVPRNASHLLIPGWLGVIRLSGPSGSTLDTNSFFVALAIVLIPCLWWYKRRIRPDVLYRISVTVLLGGLLGNLADGLRVGYPVDYLLTGSPFNLADAALVLGGGLLIYRMLKGEARQDECKVDDPL